MDEYKEYLVTLACGHRVRAWSDSVKHYQENPDIHIYCETCHKNADFYRKVSKIEEVDAGG